MLGVLTTSSGVKNHWLVCVRVRGSGLEVDGALLCDVGRGGEVLEEECVGGVGTAGGTAGDTPDGPSRLQIGVFDMISM